jgi:competence ComEA-like helix-hairpin-helix protein
MVVSEGTRAWPIDCPFHSRSQSGFHRKENLVQNNIDLNNATEQELAGIQGLNKDAARMIVEYRALNGHFNTWEDLQHIPGLPGNVLVTLKRQGCTVKGMAA